MADTKKLIASCTCMAYYTGSIKVPADYTLEEAIAYAKEHINEIPIESGLEYIGGSDELDEKNCEFGNIQEGGCKTNMDTIAWDVKMQASLYFKENLPRYTILDIRRHSYHPADHYLYMVKAKKDDGTYAVWTSWNQSTKSLNCGHYDLSSEEDCERIMDEYYFSGDSNREVTVITAIEDT